jgi:hypothetical protein
VSHRARGHYRRSTMLKKLFISAAAAAAVSVPLAERHGQTYGPTRAPAARAPPAVTG